MRLSLSRNLIATTPRRWEQQYANTTDERKRQVTERLNALDTATATAAEVAEIIGNKSWSYFNCDECSQYVEQVVEIGQDERVVTLCPSCLRAAAALGSVVL